jgi:hypothetical protein
LNAQRFLFDLFSFAFAAVAFRASFFFAFGANAIFVVRMSAILTVGYEPRSVPGASSAVARNAALALLFYCAGESPFALLHDTYLIGAGASGLEEKFIFF